MDVGFKQVSALAAVSINSLVQRALSNNPKLISSIIPLDNILSSGMQIYILRFNAVFNPAR